MHGLSVRLVRGSIVVALSVAASAGGLLAQSNVKVEVKEMSDNRIEAGGFGGSLEVKLTPSGSGLDKVVAARVRVKQARDDKGNDLVGKNDPPDFQSREYDMGGLTVQLRNPARAAKTISLSGTIDMFVPSKDPNAIVKIPKALSKKDVPLSAKALATEKVTIRLLSAEKYSAEREKVKMTDEKAAQAREMAKKEGIGEKEIEAMIELARALQEMEGGPLPPGAIVLAGKEVDLDRIQKIKVFKSDGTEISIPSRQSSTSSGETIMILQPEEVPPADAALEITLLTKKSTVSVPFELKGAQLP
jgi:hypothetical protein